MNNEGQNQKIKLSVVNLFSEFILNKINITSETLIEVVDCENFFVVKGKTSSTEVLDLNKIKEEFHEKFSKTSEKFKIGNTIDLIEYGFELESKEKMTFEFFNTIDLSSNKCNIPNTSLTFKSEFPFGHSFKMGKNLFYYAKHIAYNLQSKYTWDRLVIEISYKNNEENLKLYLDNCDEPNEELKSSILDCFTFNYGIFEKKIIDSDWWKPIIDKEKEFDFVKELNKDLILF